MQGTMHTPKRELKILPGLVVGDKESEVFFEKDTTQSLYDGVASLERNSRSQNLPLCMSSILYKGKVSCPANVAFQSAWQV